MSQPPLQVGGGPQPILSLRDTEKLAICRCLYRVDWNVAKAARVLHVSRATLYRKVKAYGLTRGQFPPDLFSQRAAA